MMEFKIKERIAGKVVRENRDPVHGVAKMVCAADKVGWEVAVMEMLEGRLVINVLKPQKVRAHSPNLENKQETVKIQTSKI